MTAHQPNLAAEAHLLAYCGGEPDLTLYTRREWLTAAQEALDGDSSELDAMTEATDQWHDYREWQGDLLWRENVELEDFVRSHCMVAPIGGRG